MNHVIAVDDSSKRDEWRKRLAVLLVDMGSTARLELRGVCELESITITAVMLDDTQLFMGFKKQEEEWVLATDFVTGYTLVIEEEEYEVSLIPFEPGVEAVRLMSAPMEWSTLGLRQESLMISRRVGGEEDDVWVSGIKVDGEWRAPLHSRCALSQQYYLDSCVSYCERFGVLSGWPGDFMSDLRFNDPGKAFELISGLIDGSPSVSVLSALAAGPLEDLLAEGHFEAEANRKAESSKAWKSALAQVWT